MTGAPERLDGPVAGGPGAGFSQSLERGLSILSAFTTARAVLGIADIAREVDLHKSTTHRYVATLTALEYLQQDPDTKKYSLGRRVVDLGLAAVSSLDITRVASGPLQALADDTGHTVSMAVLDGPNIVYVDRRHARRAHHLQLSLDLHVGSRLPAYCTAMGKVLLAHREPAALRALLDRTDLARRGPKTLTAREQLVTALDRVRQTGIATNDEELAPGLRSLAAPVTDHEGVVVAAINVALYLTMPHAGIEAVAARLEGPLRRTASDISSRMGHREHNQRR